jgi:hypothetical protein
MDALVKEYGGRILMLAVLGAAVAYCWLLVSPKLSRWRRDQKLAEKKSGPPSPNNPFKAEAITDFDWQKREPLKLRPFKPVYHITMGLSAVDPLDLIIMDKNYLGRVTLRRQLIAEHGATVHGHVAGGEDAVAELYSSLMGEYLPSRYPAMFTLSADGKMLANFVTGRTFPTSPPADTDETLRILGETVEDDIFLLKDTPHGHQSVAFICCFPMGFNPSEKLGKGLKAIHGPVPSFDKIGPSMERFFGKLEVGKNVKRANWSIQTHPELFDCRSHMTNETMEEGIKSEVDIDQVSLRKNHLLQHLD